MKCFQILFCALLIFINFNNVKCDSALNNECPNNVSIGIAYDLSTKLNSIEFQKQQDFLLNCVFNSTWTNFNKLLLFAYANDEPPYQPGFDNKTELEAFIHRHGQVSPAYDGFCTLLYKILKVERGITGNAQSFIIFVSQNSNTNDYDCKLNIQIINVITQSLLFVITKKDVRTDYIRNIFPKAQFIQWDLDKQDVPTNREWIFNTAYGCNENNDYLPNEYPCRSRILIGIDSSTNLIQDNFQKQQNFLIGSVFTQNWTNIENLAIVKYSNRTENVKEFGEMIDLNKLHNSISQTNQAKEHLELCKVFRDLTSMYLQNINLILFISKFNGVDKSWCEFPAQTIRTNANSILFITMSNEVDVNYLQYLFPYANFLHWNIPTETMPVNWRSTFETAYGCNQYSFFKQSYPCENKKLVVAFDSLNILTPFAYKKQIDFLLTNIFIESWSNFKMALLNYKFNTGYNENIYSLYGFQFLINAKMFIRTTLMIDNPTGICDTINYIKTRGLLADENLILFISEFGTEINECYGKLEDYAEAKNITFITLTSKVNQSALLASFPKANIIQWDIESEQTIYPPKWKQNFWSAFGCDGPSPLILKTTTHKPIQPSTITTTRQISTFYTTPEKQETTISTTLASTTTQSSTTTLTHSTNKPPDLFAILGGTFASLFVVLLVVVIVCFCLYRRRKRGQLVEGIAFRGSKKESNLEESDNNHENNRNNDLWRLENRNVKVFIHNMLGSGAFANVYLGRIRGDAGIKRVYPNILALMHFHDCEVAIKILPAYCTDENREDFQQELNFMKALGYHPHLVCLLGYASKQIILEYCEHGDLLQFLKRNRTNFNVDCEGSLKQKNLISFAWQVSNGMEYFASLDLTHRDLAARNILLDKNNVCKIGDFGLARMMDMENYSNKGGKIPVRWAAIECLKRFEFSTKSDVWSYAVLLYEVFTLGELPYFGRENSEILNYLEGGNRLEHPEHASSEIYNLMLSCWSANVEERPTFTDICQKLTPFLEQQTLHYNYVDAIEQALNEINVLDIFDEIEDGEVTI